MPRALNAGFVIELRCTRNVLKVRQKTRYASKKSYVWCAFSNGEQNILAEDSVCKNRREFDVDALCRQL